MFGKKSDTVLNKKSKNKIRLFSTTLITAALVGVSVVPGLFSSQHANAVAPAPIISSESTVWSYDETDTDPAAGQKDRLVWAKDGYTVPNTWKKAKGAFGFKLEVHEDGTASELPNADGLTWTTHLNSSTENPPADGMNTQTYHFRTEVTIDQTELDAAKSFDGVIRYDDAVQIFVNGVKVEGINDQDIEALPENQRNLHYSGKTYKVGKPGEKAISIPKTAFKAGKNVIAVALYQSDDQSSDGYFDFVKLAPVIAEDTKITPKALIQTVGATDSERNFTWYTMRKQVAQELQYAPASAVQNGVFPATATSVKATSDGDVHTRDFQTPEFNYRATIKNLAPETAYSYRVGNETTGWSPVYTFKTSKASGNYSFMFYGDPQIGASKDIAADGKGWDDTIKVGLEKYKNTDLLFSAGDQVENAGNETEYDAFFTPDAMRTLPFVPVIGNHDVSSHAFNSHFTVPNLDKNSGHGCATYKSNCNDPQDYSDGDYYFVHKNTLFVVLNSNTNDEKAISEHKAFMEKALKANPDVAWKVVAFHHSIYSVAAHVTKAGDSPNIDSLRGGKYNEAAKDSGLVSKISELGFDMVLMGHDHSYTRTFLLKQDGTKAHLDEAAGAHDVEAKNGEVIYLTANSASGSKFYNPQLKVDGDTDPKHKDFPVAPYASVIDQQTLRNYTNIDVQDCQLTLTTLVSGRHPKSTKQDQVKNDTVNTVVDEVVVHSKKDRCQPKPVADKPEAPKPVADKPEAPKPTVQAEAPVASIVADKQSYTQGDTVKFEANGFHAGDKVTVTLHSTPVKVAELVADANGAVTGTFVIPKDIEDGDHLLIAEDTHGNKAQTPLKIGKLPNTGTDSSQLLTLAVFALLGAGLLVTRARRR